MDRIDELKALIAVIETESFTRAASRLGIPRSTLSTVISGLEDRVGARLLQRTTRRVSPTEEGLRFAERARDLVEEAEHVETMFRGKPAVSGLVRVSMPGRIAHRIMIPALPAFLEQHPDLLVDLRISDQRLDLIAEGLDLVLRVGMLDDSSLICRRLCAAPFVNCAAPSYLKRYGSPKKPADLASHLAVSYGAAGPGQSVTVTTGETETLIRASVIVDSTEGYIAAGLAGLGIIELPRFDVEDALAAGLLVEILRDYPSDTSDIALLYPSRRHLPVRIAIVRDWIIDLIEREEIV